MVRRMTAVTAALLGALIGAALVVLAEGHFALPARAAAGTLKPAAAGNSLVDIFDGKTYPVTLNPDEIDATYHLVGLLDAQEKSGTYVTRGETVTIGDADFLVTYYVPIVPTAQAGPPQPKAGESGHLTLLNVRDIQAIAGFVRVTPPEDRPAAAPTPPAAPAPGAPQP